MKQYHLLAAKHPCTENAMNLNLLRRWFDGNAWGSVDDPSLADVIIVATCGFTKEQEDYECSLIEELGRTKKQGCELIVLGCLPKANRERLAKIFTGNTVKTDAVARFDDLLALPRKTTEFHNHFVSQNEYATDPKMRLFFKARRLFERLSWLPLVKVPRVLYTVPSETWWCVRCAMGCTGNCAFCGVKHAEFPFKSEPLDDIVAQVKQGLASGFREIALTGEELGAYGCDLQLSLADLLNEIVALPGDFKVNLRFVDPVWLIKLKDALMPAFATGKIVAFCTPAQSASDRVLKLMNRPYTFAALKATVNDIMRNGRVGMISTNLIVGFPSETREEAVESLRLIHEVDFGMYQVHKYQEHPNAASFRMPGKVDEAEMDYRFKLLHKAAVRKHAWSLLS